MDSRACVKRSCVYCTVSLMKSDAWIIIVVVVVVLWFFVRSRHNYRRADPKVYLGLRNLALQGPQVAKLNADPTKPTQPYAVLMDWGVGNGTATVAAFADGTASIYLSSGGGFLGGGQSHESIRNAAKRMVEIGGELQPLMQPTSTYPLPQKSQVTFYVRTDAGVFTASASDDDLRNHRSPFSKLGEAGQTIITEYRLMKKE